MEFHVARLPMNKRENRNLAPGSPQLELLLVEDNLPDALLTAGLLESGESPVKVKTLSDGEAALNFLFQRGEFAGSPIPDAVILDLNLPKRNGLEVLAEMRAHPPLKTVPVFILTSSRSREDVTRAYNLGASFIPKPTELAEFENVIRRLLTIDLPRVCHGRPQPEPAPPAQSFDRKPGGDRTAGFMKFFAGLSHSLRTEADPIKALQICVDQISSVLGWPVGHAYLVGDDQRGPLVGSGVWYLSEPARFEAFRKLTESTLLPPGVGLPGMVISSKGPVWLQDIGACPELPRRRIAEAVSLSTAFAVPIFVGGKVAGILEFFSDEDIAKDDTTISVVSHAADQIGILLQSLGMEDAARESQKRIQNVLETALDAFVGLNADGLIIDWNGQAEQTFGWSRQEAMGRPLEDMILPQQYRESHRLGMKRFLHTKEGLVLNRRIEITALHKDGHEFPVELHISPTQLKNGYVFNGFIRDLSDRKRQEPASNRVVQRTSQLEQANQELTKSNAELEQFAYIASHDLQEPLRMVVTYLQYLEKRNQDTLGTEDRQFIKFAITGALRMRALIDDLLAFSRVGRGAQNKEPVAFNEVVDTALSTLKHAVETSKAQIDCAQLPTITVDRAQMVQLFQQLLSNAMKYQSDKPLRISIKADRRGPEWILSVKDNGIGIDPKYAERIFVVFQRLNSDREKYPGTGIGLAICKKIVEQHKGGLWVESEAGQGAAFYFSLPANE